MFFLHKIEQVTFLSISRTYGDDDILSPIKICFNWIVHSMANNTTIRATKEKRSWRYGHASYRTVPYRTVPYSTARHGTARHSTAQHSEHSTAQHKRLKHYTYWTNYIYCTYYVNWTKRKHYTPDLYHTHTGHTSYASKHWRHTRIGHTTNTGHTGHTTNTLYICLLYTSPSPRD